MTKYWFINILFLCCLSYAYANCNKDCAKNTQNCTASCVKSHTAKYSFDEASCFDRCYGTSRSCYDKCETHEQDCVNQNYSCINKANEDPKKEQSCELVYKKCYNE